MVHLHAQIFFEACTRGACCESGGTVPQFPVVFFCLLSPCETESGVGQGVCWVTLTLTFGVESLEDWVMNHGLPRVRHVHAEILHVTSQPIAGVRTL